MSDPLPGVWDNEEEYTDPGEIDTVSTDDDNAVYSSPPENPPTGEPTGHKFLLDLDEDDEDIEEVSIHVRARNGSLACDILVYDFDLEGFDDITPATEEAEGAGWDHDFELEPDEWEDGKCGFLVVESEPENEDGVHVYYVEALVTTEEEEEEGGTMAAYRHYYQQLERS